MNFDGWRDGRESNIYGRIESASCGGKPFVAAAVVPSFESLSFII